MKEIALVGAKAAGRVALVDDEDYDLVMQYRWYVKETRKSGRSSGPYAMAHIYRNGRPTTQTMHQMITGYARTDHIDHDGLNNQRSNLRAATGQQNVANSRIQLRDKSSRYKGVSWHRSSRRWDAHIKVNRTSYFLGSFANEEDAALAYNAAALEAFGEYAFLNEVPDAERAA